MLRRLILNYISKCYPIIKIFRTIIIIGILPSYSLFRLHYNNCIQWKFHPSFLGWGQAWRWRGGGHALNAGKQLQRSFTTDAKKMHSKMTNVCITVYILENQVNYMWNTRMIYRSKWHLGTEVQPKTCSSSPTEKLLGGKLFTIEVQAKHG